MTAAAQPPARLRVAHVRRVHGVHGEVRAEPCGGGADRFARGTRLTVEGSDRVLTVRSVRDGGEGTLLLGFEEVRDPDAAAALRGMYLVVPRTSARSLGADEWFTWQLLGLAVRSPAGEDLGLVEDVEESVAGDILVVRGREEVRRYPMVRAFVKDVDVERGCVTVEPLEEVQA